MSVDDKLFGKKYITIHIIGVYRNAISKKKEAKTRKDGCRMQRIKKEKQKSTAAKKRNPAQKVASLIIRSRRARKSSR